MAAMFIAAQRSHPSTAGLQLAVLPAKTFCAFQMPFYRLNGKVRLVCPAG